MSPGLLEGRHSAGGNGSEGGVNYECPPANSLNILRIGDDGLRRAHFEVGATFER